MPQIEPVLVVEDDTDCRIMVATLLTSAGYRVVTASNGAEGLTVAKRHRPCLILLDYMMPIMDGAQFRNQQRQDPEIAAIPVLLVSARYEAERIAMELDAVGVVEKPIAFDALLKTVGEHCDPKNREQ